MTTIIKSCICGMIFLTGLSLNLISQDLAGAWKLISQDGKNTNDETIRIYADGYFMFGTHSNGAFANAGGGTYELKGKEYREVLDFNTADSGKVRQPLSLTISLKNDELTLSTQVHKQVWKRVDNSTSALAGAWRFGARVDDNGVAGERRGSAAPRQTMKILSGKHFQWAAFNYETKEFFGTGGGTYEVKDNKYTETIRFFSRDNSKAGISLTFDCRIDGKDWYHKGKGTTGNPVSEVWEKIR